MRNTKESTDTQSKVAKMVVPELLAHPPFAAIHIRSSLAARFTCQQDLKLWSRNLRKGTAGKAT